MNYEVIQIIDLDWTKGQALVEMVGWHHRHDGHEFEQADGQKSLVCDHGVTESDTTDWLNWPEGSGLGLPRWLSGKESASQCRRCGFSPWVGKIPWRRERKPIPVVLPEKSHGQRSLVGYSPSSHKESGTTQWLSTQTHEGEAQSFWWINI